MHVYTFFYIIFTLLSPLPTTSPLPQVPTPTWAGPVLPSC
jgi:hypothetical protein